MTGPRVPRLAGRRILLTGASSGVGLAAVGRFAAEGADLVLVVRRADALRAFLQQQGLEATVIAADLSDRAATTAAVDEAARVLGGVDIVVSNAAAAVFGHVAEVHPDDFDRTVAVTFTGPVNLIRAALPHLRASRGTIVATGSLNARLPLAGWSSYSASKHALRGFLNSLALEERERGTGVRVTTIHPGPIDTPLFAHASSATGRSPRVPPDAYRPEVVAQALVEAAVKPRGEVTLGGETRAVGLMFPVARPLVELVFLLVDRWYRSGEEPSPRPGSLWRAPGRVELSGGLPARDSLFAQFQLGPRMRPERATPLRLVRNLAGAALGGARLARHLVRGSAETPSALPTRDAARD